MINYGKQFEARFKEDWKRAFPKSFLYRLPDLQSGMLGSTNPCDFFAFQSPHLFMIECKSHDGASIPFSAMPQYQRLINFKNIENLHPGFIIWFKQKDRVIWVDITTAESIHDAGHKSIGLSMLSKYPIIELPSVKKRVFMETDYSKLMELYDETT